MNSTRNSSWPLTGFDAAEVEALLNSLDAEPAPEQPAEIDESELVISRVEDKWILGDHVLICGDAIDPAVYSKLLGTEKAQTMFTDPPYNVPVGGHNCDLGKVQHDEFVMASGEMSQEEFTSFLTDVTANLTAFSCDGSMHYVCMDWRHMQELLTAGAASYTELKNLVFVFKHGTAPHINNFGLGQHGRYRTNLWDYAGVNFLKAERDEELAMRPTVRPVAMVADAIRDCSPAWASCLIAFSGSGTTIMAAEQTGRKARAIELDPRYVDVAIRRWQDATGRRAHSAASGIAFDDCAALAEELAG